VLAETKVYHTIPGVGSVGGASLLIPLVLVFPFVAVKQFPVLGRALGIGLTELRKEA
jgi:hypothetical protein